MVPRKVEKKLDALGDDSNPNADVLSDTTLQVIDVIKSWKKVFDILEHEILTIQMTMPRKMTNPS
jgi:hypothetical protein